MWGEPRRQLWERLDPGTPVVAVLKPLDLVSKVEISLETRAYRDRELQPPELFCAAGQ